MCLHLLVYLLRYDSPLGDFLLTLSGTHYTERAELSGLFIAPFHCSDMHLDSMWYGVGGFPLQSSAT